MRKTLTTLDANDPPTLKGSKSGGAFEEKFLAAVEKAFPKYGEDVLPVVYYHIETRYLMKQAEVATRPHLLDKAIESMFGTSAHLIKHGVIREIQQSLSVRKPCETIEEAFNEAKLVSFGWK